MTRILGCSLLACLLASSARAEPASLRLDRASPALREQVCAEGRVLLGP